MPNTDSIVRTWRKQDIWTIFAFLGETFRNPRGHGFDRGAWRFTEPFPSLLHNLICCESSPGEYLLRHSVHWRQISVYRVLNDCNITSFFLYSQSLCSDQIQKEKENTIILRVINVNTSDFAPGGRKKLNESDTCTFICFLTESSWTVASRNLPPRVVTFAARASAVWPTTLNSIM